MAVLVFVLSLALLVAGAASGAMSLDLLPTGPGLVYAFAGVVLAVGAVVVFALGVVAVRVGRLTGAVREQAAAVAAAAAFAPPAEAAAFAADDADSFEIEAPAEEIEAEPDPEAVTAPAADRPQLQPPAGGVEPEEPEEPLNANRAGRLPTLGAIERAIETPEAPPTLIGRYSSGGANYMIFSDGSIEAETDAGAFKFASMGDFKRFLRDHNAGNP